MRQSIPDTMRAVAIDGFGGPDALALRSLPVPETGPDEVLIRVEVAGVGEWDPFEREGGYAELLGTTPTFPYVLGSEGAGTVVAAGERVSRFRPGDRVYACGFLNPKGGFYAEYAAVDAGYVSSIPSTLTIEQAAVMSGVGTTALRGLDDTLSLKPGESLMIVGAGGDGSPDQEIIERLNRLIEAGPFVVHIAQTFPLDQAAEAHRALDEHYLGKLALLVR